MKRLRHKETGDVFGYNANMAALPTMEEFDDGEEATSTASSRKSRKTAKPKAQNAKKPAEAKVASTTDKPATASDTPELPDVNDL